MTDFAFREGYLQVFCGCMNSGKGLHLLQHIQQLNYARQYGNPHSVYKAFKPTTDDRDGPFIKSRSLDFSVSAPFIPDKFPELILQNLDKDVPQTVICDEVQFFSNNFPQVLKHLLQQRHHVLVAGLDLNFRGEVYDSMGEVLAMANSVKKLTSICTICGNVATRTQRLYDGKPVPYNSPITVVGDKKAVHDPKTSYEPRCLWHHEVPRFS